MYFLTTAHSDKRPDFIITTYNLTVVSGDSSVLTEQAASASIYCFVVQTVITDNGVSCIHRCCISNNTEELMKLVYAAVALSPTESVTQQAFNAKWSWEECQPTVSWFNPPLLPVLTQDPLMQP